MALKRINIDLFQGLNTFVNDNISKKTELRRAENARSVKLGSIEKRRGYRRLGSTQTATANLGMFNFDNDDKQ